MSTRSPGALEREAEQPDIGVDPAFDTLRSDQRFTAMVRRLGLSP